MGFWDGFFNIVAEGTANAEIKAGTLEVSNKADYKKQLIDKLDSGVNAAENGINSALDGADYVGNALNNVGNIFSSGSPDGVTSQFERKIAANTKSLNALSSYASIDVNAKAGIAPSLLNENTPRSGEGILYQQFVDSEEFDATDKNTGGTKKVGLGTRPYSVFNKYSLVNYQGSPLFPETDQTPKSYNKISPASIKNPTATKIIEITSSIPENYGYRYDYSDFALTRYFGKLPNNQMITLRRFAFPCPDDIISPLGPDGSPLPQPDIARAVTWMGEQTGNTIAEIMKFSHGFNWEEAEAEVQEIESKRGSRAGQFGELINSSAFLKGAVGAAQGKSAVDIARQEAEAGVSGGGFDPMKQTYPNHVFGPLNVIKSVLQRKQGLTFDNEFSLKFEYELRELGGANPKVLMLDQLSNILSLTYNNAPFWGGSVRYLGDGSVAFPLGDVDKLRSGDFGGFAKSLAADFSSGMGNTFNSLGDFANTLGKGISNALGGSLMELFNSPQGGQIVKALLTGDPTGQWHVTIGNPLNPIAVIGNLALQGTDVSFEGALGPDDFPERMVVTVKLKPGRPRDKAEIESMFNAGRGRFYLAPKDGVDINKSIDINAYGRAGDSQYTNTFRKIANG